MASYRIVCTDQEPADQPTTHAHIVAVGTGTDPAKADKRWTLQEVLAAMDTGHTFYTQGNQSGKVASVEPYNCGRCGRRHIRSAPDSVQDNNLDSLRRCSWKT